MASDAAKANSSPIPVNSSTLRAALFSSACERRKDKYGVSLINVDLGPMAIVPIPFERTEQILRGARHEQSERGVAARCVHRQHLNCGGLYDKLNPPAPARVPSRASANDNDQGYFEEGAGDEPRNVDVDIDFCETELTTTVTVTAAFRDVTEALAAKLLSDARPFRWSKHKTFFKESRPIVRSKSFLPNQSIAEQLVPAAIPALDDTSPYHILEHVEWNWTPELVGGLVNILNITPNKDADTVVSEVTTAFESLDPEAPNRKSVLDKSNKQSLRDDVGTLCEKHPALHAKYEYELVRSIQSKFTSSWELGGLDIDEGSFAAGWYRKQKMLFIRASKRVRYSEEAEEAFGASRVLNLIAPAAVSMLMRNLVYDGVAEAVEMAKRPHKNMGRPR